MSDDLHDDHTQILVALGKVEERLQHQDDCIDRLRDQISSLRTWIIGLAGSVLLSVFYALSQQVGTG